MHKYTLLVCLLALAFAARLLPVDGLTPVMAGIVVSDPVADAEESGEGEWETSSKHRQADTPVWDRSALAAAGTYGRAQAADRLGDRGADDIPTPPPDRCG